MNNSGEFDDFVLRDMCVAEHEQVKGSVTIIIFHVVLWKVLVGEERGRRRGKEEGGRRKREWMKGKEGRESDDIPWCQDRWWTFQPTECDRPWSHSYLPLPLPNSAEVYVLKMKINKQKTMKRVERRDEDERKGRRKKEKGGCVTWASNRIDVPPIIGFQKTCNPGTNI